MNLNTLREFFRAKKEIVKLELDGVYFYVARYKRWYHFKWRYTANHYTYKKPVAVTWQIHKEDALYELSKKFKSIKTKYDAVLTIEEVIH